MSDHLSLTRTLEKAQNIGQSRFACIGDLSRDIEGGLEFAPARPLWLAHVSPVMSMAADSLVAALRDNASWDFAGMLLPHLRSVTYSEDF